MATRREFLVGAGALATTLLTPDAAAGAAPSGTAASGLPAHWGAASVGFERAQDALASLYDLDRSIANFDAAYYGR